MTRAAVVSGVVPDATRRVDGSTRQVRTYEVGADGLTIPERLLVMFVGISIFNAARPDGEERLDFDPDCEGLDVFLDVLNEREAEIRERFREIAGDPELEPAMRYMNFIHERANA